MPSQGHDKGRDCARTEEVLDTYRRRALKAESRLTKLATNVTEARAALNAAIVAERAKGRTLESIAQEVGMTRAGVLYVVRKAEP